MSSMNPEADYDELMTEMAEWIKAEHESMMREDMQDDMQR